VQALAGKIANLAGRSRLISLEVKNISSLNAADGAAIRQALEVELTQRRFRLVPATSAEAKVVVTLSEGVSGYIWVAQVGGGAAEQTVILPVSRTEASTKDAASGSLVLEAKLVWQQAGKFLDFAELSAPVGFSSMLVILEPDRLAYYHSTDAVNWQFWQRVPISPANPWPRDLRGSVSGDSGDVSLPSVRCTGALDPAKVQCAPDRGRSTSVKVKIPGHEESESVLLPDRCGEESIVLSTGNGDWTEPDSIQGYLLPGLDQNARVSGAPIQMQGPVISLSCDLKQSGAHAIVHNLKTGNYEAYVVTATCGR